MAQFHSFLLLQGLTLHFVVLSFDRYSRDDVIGEVMLELESIDLSASDTCPVPIAREITPRSYKVSCWKIPWSTLISFRQSIRSGGKIAHP